MDTPNFFARSFSVKELFSATFLYKASLSIMRFLVLTTVGRRSGRRSQAAMVLGCMEKILAVSLWVLPPLMQATTRFRRSRE